MKKILHSRRQFVRDGIVLTSALPFLSVGKNILSGSKYMAPAATAVPLRFINHPPAGHTANVTWGTPWPVNTIKKGTGFILQDANGNKLPVQTWPLSYWPDGSLKWTGHAAAGIKGEGWQMVPAKPAPVGSPIKITETAASVIVDTGVITCTIEKQGQHIISGILRDNRPIAQNGRLVLLHKDTPDNEEGTAKTTSFAGTIKNVIVEQQGPVRAVIQITGTHTQTENSKTLLPFTIRLYFYTSSEAIRILHTITYDGDENKDFIQGIGIRFSIPMQEELHNRHIRFVGEEKGVFAEAVRGITGLRRDAGKEARDAQVAGKKAPVAAELPKAVGEHLHLVPAFGDYTLHQSSSGSFTIKKRTGAAWSWLQAAQGTKATGLAWLGTPAGGLAFGIRNFWQSYPGQLDIRNAQKETAEITMWLWAPQSPAMDLRFYHDGMGQDTYTKQREGLDITYEDYEPGFGTAYGVARTSELKIWALPATPSANELTLLSQELTEPTVLLSTEAYMATTGVFGAGWSIADTSTPAKAAIEEDLQRYFEFYNKQIDQHNWYGFWNYGDVMHSYDEDRHVWRYDVGGFAWDNSELSTDLWLWYYFLRTGRGDVFKMAEAMTRHTGEVDVHHIGPFAPLGSRHNVLHWGCSAKQLRISTAANRRFYYYLTADERTGELMREQVQAERTLVAIPPGRKLGVNPQPVKADTNATKASINFGTDWGALASAWFTEWERTGNTTIKEKLVNSMKTIAAQPHGFFSGSAVMELATGKFERVINVKPVVSHLSAAFGLPEICTELIQTIPIKEFENAWLQYCTLYNAPPAEQKAALGEDLGKQNLRQGHSRLTAYAAWRTGNATLARRAWNEFYGNSGNRKVEKQLSVNQLSGPQVLTPREEAAAVSTNGIAQWSLAAMQCLAFIGKEL